jgi:hypothetical protein
MVNNKIPRDPKQQPEPARMVRNAMRAYFLVLRTRGKTEAQTEEEFYGFRARDVVEMHFQEKGPNRGVWFRLKDGRAINAFGEGPKRARSRYTAAKRKRNRPRS